MRSGGGGGDRVDKGNDRAARDTARAEKRAHREDRRYAEERATILTEADKTEICKMVDRAGFEPAYGNPGRFTVCCL